MIDQKTKLPAYAAFEFHPVKTTAICLLQSNSGDQKKSKYHIPPPGHLLEIDIESQAEVKRFRLPDDPFHGQQPSNYPQIFISNARRFETIILVDAKSTVFIIDWSHTSRLSLTQELKTS